MAAYISIAFLSTIFESEMFASVRQVLQNTKIARGGSLSARAGSRTLASGKDLQHEGGELYRKRGGNIAQRQGDCRDRQRTSNSLTCTAGRIQVCDWCGNAYAWRNLVWRGDGSHQNVEGIVVQGAGEGSREKREGCTKEKVCSSAAASI